MDCRVVEACVLIVSSLGEDNCGRFAGTETDVNCNKIVDRSIHRSIPTALIPQLFIFQAKQALTLRTLTPSFQGSNPCSPAIKGL